MSIKYIFGKTGTGKSHMADSEAGTAAYWKDGGSKWFHGYEGEENVVIDEYRSGFPYGVFLQLLDKYPLKVEVKGGMPEFVAKKLWITSHFAPHELYGNIADKSELYRRLEGCVYRLTTHNGVRYLEPMSGDGTRSLVLSPIVIPNDRPEEPVARTLATMAPDVCMCDLLECGTGNAQCRCDCHDPAHTSDDDDGPTQGF